MLSVGTLILENLNEKTHAVPDERLKDASAGREKWLEMVRADERSAARRNEVQAMLDGKPPYDQSVLAATGQGGLTNLNFGDAAAKQEAAMEAMIDLLASLETFVKVPLKRNAVADEATRTEYEEILADEVSTTFRRWPRFEANYLTVCHKWLAHGVGVAYFENCYDWRWEATGLGDIQIPRKTKASEDFIEIASCRRGYKLHELYAKIKDEEAADKLGWNVELVRKAMVKADRGANQSWDAMQNNLRNNDLCDGGSSEEISLIHLWVQEFDGKVSMYICLEMAIEPTGTSSDKTEPWLYKKRGEYESMQQAFVMFPYGIGTNGTYHSIPGLMEKIYAQAKVMDRLRSRMVDCAAISSGIILQVENERALGHVSFASVGPWVLAPPKDVANIVERAVPNLLQNAIPVLADMQHSMDARAGQTKLESPLQQGRERTRFEVQALMDGDSRIGITRLNLFYPPLGRLLRESTRRLCKRDYSDAVSGGKEATDFRRRLTARGFHVELLSQIDFDAVDCVRATGAGSFANRTAVFSELTEMSGGFDEQGRHNLMRDRVAAALRSFDQANRYVPRLMGDTRPPVDKSIAKLENNDMEKGQAASVEMNDKDVVHLDVHLPFLADMVDAYKGGQAGLETVGPMVMNHEHCTAHLERIQQDTTIQEKTAMYRQALQQLGEEIFNAQRKLEAQQRKEAEAAQQGEEEQQQASGGGGGGGASPEMVMKLAESRMKLQILAEQAQLKRQIQLEKHAQDMALKDSQNAAKIMATAQQYRRPA